MIRKLSFKPTHFFACTFYFFNTLLLLALKTWSSSGFPLFHYDFKKHPVSLKSFPILLHTKKGKKNHLLLKLKRTTFCVLSVNLHCETPLKSLPLGLWQLSHVKFWWYCCWQGTFAKPNVNLYSFAISIGCWHAFFAALHFCCLGFESGFSGIYCTMIWTMSIAFLLSLILSHEIEPCSRFSSPKILFFLHINVLMELALLLLCEVIHDHYLCKNICGPPSTMAVFEVGTSKFKAF